MSLLTELRGVWSGPLTSSSPELARLWAAPPTSTGVGVSEQTALNYSAVWAAVSLISSQVASLPLILYARRKDGGKERKPNHPLYWLLHDEPNPEMSSFTFREALQAHALTWGNGYAEIERDGADRPKALWPLTPDRVTPIRDRRTLELAYQVANPNGGPPTMLDPHNILHIPGLGFDGTVGYSVVSKARESIGLGIATERFGGAFFGNGATFGGILKHPGKISPTAQQNLIDQIESRHQGLSRSHRFLLLQEAMDYVATGVPPDAAQFLETRRFQIVEVCRWFMIPPHKLRDLERATFSNIEQQAIEFVTDTLRPWLIRWEQEVQRKLVAPLEQGIQFAEHLVDGLLRGDIKSRYDAYAVGRQWGWLSADDVREKENMNPLADGDGAIYLVPMNMTPANRVDELISSQITKNTAPPPAPNNPPADTKPESNAAPLIDALREQLAEAQREAATQLARAVTAETTSAQSDARRTELDAEATAARTALAEADKRIAALSAQLQLASERVEQERAERERQTTAFAEATCETAGLVGTQTERAVTAEAARDVAVTEVLAARALVAERDAALAESRAAVEALEARIGGMVTAEDATELRSQLEALTAEHATRTQAHDAAVAALADAELRATNATVARAAADEALTAQRDGEVRRLTAVLAAHRGLIVDAMGRIVQREGDRARKHQATGEKLRAWVNTFYVTHEDAIVDALLPAVRVHLAWAQSADDPLTLTRRFAREHVAESVRQLRVVASEEPDDLHRALERMLQRWDTDRPAALADQILRDEVEHVRSL